MQIENAVYESLSFLTGLDTEELRDSSDIDLFENGILDSLSFAQCISDVADATGIKISIKDLNIAECSTIESLIRVLRTF